MTLINSVVSGNAADLAGGRGGALYMIGGLANASVINTRIGEKRDRFAILSL